MLVKYSVEVVGPIGLGMIAQEDIPEGTMVFNHEVANLRKFTTPAEYEAYLDTLSEEEQKKVISYTYCCNNDINLPEDGIRFLNHSWNPNIGYKNETIDQMFAYRDIKKGEELLADYNEFQHIDWLEEVSERRGGTSCRKLLKVLNNLRESV